MATFEEELEEYVRLTIEARGLKERAKEIRGRTDELRPRLLAEWERRNWTTGPRLAGLGLPHLHKDRRAFVGDPERETTGEDWERACRALEAAGMGDIVQERANLNTLSAYFREWDEEGRPPPPELEGAVGFQDFFDIRVRR